MSEVVTGQERIKTAAHWSLMGHIMAGKLEKIIENREITHEYAGIPKGVYIDAKEFFRFVSQGLDDNNREDLELSLGIYTLADDTLQHSQPSEILAIREREQWLRQFVFFVNHRLAIIGTLKADELKVAAWLQQFFKQLGQDGDAERSSRTYCSFQ